MARQSRTPAPVRVIYRDGSTELRAASSFQKRAVGTHGHGRRAARVSVRNQRRQLSIARAQGRMLDREWVLAEERDDAGADAA
jgi:hypothetical protein